MLSNAISSQLFSLSHALRTRFKREPSPQLRVRSVSRRHVRNFEIRTDAHGFEHLRLLRPRWLWSIRRLTCQLHSLVFRVHDRDSIQERPSRSCRSRKVLPSVPHQAILGFWKVCTSNNVASKQHHFWRSKSGSDNFFTAINSPRSEQLQQLN